MRGGSPVPSAPFQLSLLYRGAEELLLSPCVPKAAGLWGWHPAVLSHGPVPQGEEQEDTNALSLGTWGGRGAPGPVCWVLAE